MTVSAKHFPRVLLVLGLMTPVPTGAPAQNWCYEGECATNCPHTLYAPQYDWWWCSCPTSANCNQDPLQTCNRCYTSMVIWCDDPLDLCQTYYLGGYDQFCGCQTQRAQQRIAVTGSCL